MHHNVARRPLTQKPSRILQKMIRSTSTSTLDLSVPVAKKIQRARYPLPPLRDTLDRYLTSIEPFLREEEARGGQDYGEARKVQQKIVDEWELGLGKKCQERLQSIAKDSPNWLEEHFWTKKVYLQSRGPLLIHSNWWLAFLNDPLIPKEEIQAQLASVNGNGITKWQIRRAAWIVHRILKFRDKWASTTPTSKNDVWIQESTAALFNACRVPYDREDSLETCDPREIHNIVASSIYLSVHNFFYFIRVYDIHHRLLPVSYLERSIAAAAADAKSRKDAGVRAPPIGILSADGRDYWNTNLNTLVQHDPLNSTWHQVLKASLLGLSLDDHVHTIDPTSLTRSSNPVRQAEYDSLLHAIRGTQKNVSNRFFDKPLTIIVDPAARAGAMGEHAPVDALVPSMVAEYALEKSVDVSAFVSTEKEKEILPTHFSFLDWQVPNKMWEEFVNAQLRADRILADSDDSVLWFESYGVDWIQENTGLSSDAWIQMAMQLAWFRQQGEFTATYETALTKQFHKGRTETIRTFTNESRDWVLTMTSPLSNTTARRDKLRLAVAKHSRLTREAMTGRGVDRHLFALFEIIHNTFDEPGRDWFSQERLFERSKTWKLSTSGLSPGPFFLGTGFGSPLHDGYGINYMPGPTRIKFGVESKKTASRTNTADFQHAISTALLDMQALWTAESPKARL